MTTSPYMSQVRTRPAAWRAIVSVLVCVLAIVGALMALFAAAITWTGCFIGCTGTNHAGGAALAALAALLLATGPAAVSGLYRSAAWMRAACWTFGAGLVAALLVVASA